MKIDQKEKYEVVKHDGSTVVMKGDRLLNYLIAFRDSVKVVFKEVSEEPPSEEPPSEEPPIVKKRTKTKK